MEEEKKMNMVVVPLIDSGNPPIGVDSVILGESGTGAVRLSCFAGDAYVVREEEIQQDDGTVKKLWVRPVCVVDMGNNAIEYLESYLIFRLGTKENELKTAQKKFPEFMKTIYEALSNEYGTKE